MRVNFLPTRYGLLSAFLFCLMALLDAREAMAQCAMCQEALTSGNAGGTNDSGENLSGLPRGMFWSIVLLLGTIFSLAGGVVFLIVREGRQPVVEEAVRASGQPGLEP